MAPRSATTFVPLLTVLAALALTLLIGLCLQQVLTLTPLNAAITRQHERIEHAQHLAALLDQAIAGRRAFLLTGTARYAEISRAAVADFTLRTASNRRLYTAAAPDELDAFTQASAARLAYSDQVLAAFAREGHAAGIARLNAPQAETVAAASAAAYTALANRLFRELQTLATREQEQTRRLILLIGLTGILIMLLILPYGLYLLRTISRLHTAEQTMRAGNAFNESLLRTIPLPMSIVDRDGHILYQNEPMLRLRGEDLQARTCWQIMTGSDRPCADCPLHHGPCPDETRTITITLPVNGHTYIVSHTWMHYRGTPAVLEIFNDITEQIRSADQLREYAQQLEWNNVRLETAVAEAQAASRAKSSFLATMSHELRTPMNSIIGFANVLLKHPPASLNSDERLFLERILANGRHLLATINDILDISKIENGRAQVAGALVDLLPLIREVAGQADALRADGQVRLVMALPSAPALLYTDSQRFRQVLFNLVGNAMKFTERGAITVRLDSDAATGVPYRLTVSDTGIGIPAEHLGRLFEPFFQVDTGPTRKFGGTGLGLAIVRALARQLGWSVSVASAVGQGTRFTLELHPYLPLPAVALPAESAPPAVMPELLHHRLLLVGDRPDGGTGFEPAPELLAAQLLTADNPAIFSDLLAVSRPTAIILLPPYTGLTGAAAVAAVRRNPLAAALPLVVLAPVPDTGAGDCHWLAPPFSREQFLAALDAATAGRPA